MSDIHERLRAVARAGFERRLKALLQDLGGKALAQNKDGWTALMGAALNGHEGCVRLLLPVSDALARDARGSTALMWAALNGHEDCIGLLLPASDALAQNTEGRTALMWAARYGHERCVHILLPASDALAQDKQGRTASVWARNYEHEIPAQWIDVYARAQSERADLEVAASSGAPRGRAALRV